MKNGFRKVLAVIFALMLLVSAAAVYAEGDGSLPEGETKQEEVISETAAEQPQAETADDAKEEEEENKSPDWLHDAVAKFGETPLKVWITFATILACGIVLLVVSKTRKQWTTQAIAYAALSIALSFVLSCIRLFRMPNSGSVTPASMLPIMLFSAAFGVGPGLLTGMAYGVLQCIQGGGVAAAGGFAQFALDYLLAFTVLGLAGLAKKLPEKWGLYCAIAIAVLMRLACHTLAGVLFWNTELWASFVYNISYLGPELVICLVLAVAIAKPVMRIMKSR